MLNEEKVSEIYERMIEENLIDIEREKKQARNEKIIKLIITITIAIIAYVIVKLPIVHEKYVTILENITSNLGFLGLIIQFSFSYPFFIVYFTIVFPLCFLYVAIAEINNKYYAYIYNFNNRMINKITEIYNEKLEYLPLEGINEEIYIKEAQFEKFDKYTSSHLMKGMLANNCKLEIAQIIAHYLAPYLTRGKYYRS